MNFHSEFGEDIFLWENYEDYFTVPRFYVDVGAGSPGHKSNTAWLRGLGWTGLAIDAHGEWADQWETGFIQAIIHTAPKVNFDWNLSMPYLSRVSTHGAEVETHRLDELLFLHRVEKLGFLSIDVEGQETEVLKSLSLFPAHNWPPFIISEYNTDGIGEDFSARDYLSERGYKVIHQTIANLIYYDESRRVY
jgi:hypothetical protein